MEEIKQDDVKAKKFFKLCSNKKPIVPFYWMAQFMKDTEIKDVFMLCTYETYNSSKDDQIVYDYFTNVPRTIYDPSIGDTEFLEGCRDEKSYMTVSFCYNTFF